MDMRYGRVFVAGSVVLGGLGAGGCLRANEDHCLFAGGDFAGDGNREICVVPEGEQLDPDVDTRGLYELPAGTVRAELTRPNEHTPGGYSWAAIGLPREEGDIDTESLHTLFGMTNKLVGGAPEMLDCIQTGYLQRVWDESGLDGFYYHELEGRRVSSRSLEFPTSDLSLVTDAVWGEVQRCADMVGSVSMEADTEGGGETEADQSGGGEDDSTGDGPPLGCREDADCGKDAPLCWEGQCAPCNLTEDEERGHASCREADMGSPVCLFDEGKCVPCTWENQDTCTDQDQWCDGNEHSCVECTEHHHCTSGACDSLVRECFDDNDKVYVRGVVAILPDTYPSISAALEGTAAQEKTLIVLEGGLDSATWENVTIHGRVVAIISADEEQAVWNSALGADSTLSIGGSETRVYLNKIRLVQLFNNNRGILCEDGMIDIRRSRIVSHGKEVIRVREGGRLVAINSFVAASRKDADALQVFQSDAAILYSTVGAGDGDAKALYCQGESDVLVRNSILVTQTSGAEIDCVATVEHSAVEQPLGGTNETLPPTEIGWFTNYSNGDFHLTPPVPSSMETTGRWQWGDPPFDIDGQLRSESEGSVEWVGADVPI